jgi:hypothetical protein
VCLCVLMSLILSCDVAAAAVCDSGAAVHMFSVIRDVMCVTCDGCDVCC